MFKGCNYNLFPIRRLLDSIWSDGYDWCIWQQSLVDAWNDNDTSLHVQGRGLLGSLRLCH